MKNWKLCFRLISLFLLLPAVVIAADKGDLFDSDGDYLADDPKTCLMCHSEGGPAPAEDIMHGAHAVTGNSRSPFAKGNHGCQSCHGPSSEHMSRAPDGSRPPPPMVFDEGEPQAQGDAVCLSCHEQDTGHHWQGSAHEFAEVSCTACHSVHDPNDRATGPQGDTGICLDCHQRERAELHFASSHPMDSGQMACTDCHAPHGGPGPAAMFEHTINDQCYQCHAEKRGPFLWEHAPVSEDCTLCHKPHGSNHRDLLQARTPWLCQQCHMAPFHPSSAESGTGIPPRGASANMLGQDCSNCHSRVHGSNHPSGSGLTR